MRVSMNDETNKLVNPFKYTVFSIPTKLYFVNHYDMQKLYVFQIMIQEL